MGLVANEGKFAVLSHSLGDEGHFAKMDFKVVGKDPKTKKWKLSRKVLFPKTERIKKLNKT
jgi:polyribonucleotide nucleotidyltransferase